MGPSASASQLISAVARPDTGTAGNANVRCSALLFWLAAFIVFEVIRVKLQSAPFEWSLVVISRLVSALECIEVYYILKLSREMHSQDCVSWGEAAAIVLALAVLMIVVDAKPLVVLGFISVYILVRMIWARRSRVFAVSLLAFSFQYLFSFGPMIWLHSLVGILDATVVRAALTKLGYPVSGFGSIIFSPDSTFAINVEVGCSSSFAAASVLSGFAIFVLGRRRRFQATDLGWLIGLLLATTCLNWLRLTPMALSREGWLFWHEGEGSSLIALCDAVLVLIFAWAALHSKASPRISAAP